MATIRLLLLVATMLPIAAPQRQNSNISLGSSLTPTNNSYWPSKSGQFAFGFYPEGNGFAIGIWLATVPNKTVVWTANRNGQLHAGDVILTLNDEGRLVSRNNRGLQVLVINAPQSASYGSMLDIGNFVLYNSKSEVIWQSFDTPTDTILPGQHLLVREDLVSSVSETNHSSGRFALRMRGNGNLVLYAIQPFDLLDEYIYWRSGTLCAGDNLSLNLDKNGELYLSNASGFKIKVLNEGGKKSARTIYRATIDADGIFRLYSNSLDPNSNWSIEWASTDNKCDPIGLCGLNAYCTVLYQEPECACPPGFDFIDQAQKKLGCQRRSTSDDCKIKGSQFTILELEDVEWEDNAFSISSGTKSACKDDCLRDRNCNVAVFGKKQCKKQKLPLRFGKNVKNGSVTTFIKVSIGEKESRKETKMPILVAGISFLSLAFVLLAISCLLFRRCRIKESKRKSGHGNGNDALLGELTLRSFSYDELRTAANNFTHEIGKGAFGTVFKAVINNGKRVVAVKRLERAMDEGEREFRNEMKAIGRTHHKNLVRLLGYCYDGTNKLLVYEYMSNGSLADFLFRAQRKPAWDERIAIALNIARGIFYLHEECETQIIHCDIKPENILMDEKQCAKVADFGLSKLLMPSQSKTYTGIRGTRGYVAPEWHRNLPITAKADVYSFGIMLLEIICCRRTVDNGAPEDEVVLVNWVYDCFEARELNKLVKDEELETSRIERMVKVGLWCIQDEASLRPSMKKVILMLEGTVDIPDPPSPSIASSLN